MRTWLYILFLAAVTSVGCGKHQTVPDESQSLTPGRAVAVDDGVRAFIQVVAHDVTEDGPVAWRRHFADTPSFFMAVDGSMAFPNSAAATAGIQSFARTIKQIELRWGDDLRVDPLTPNLAVVATTYHEVQVQTTGQRVEENGFFTGTAEYRDGRWQFRNAHWSDPVPPPPAR